MQVMMMKTTKTQADKFKQAARDLETDNDEKRFDKTLKNLVKSGKKPEPKIDAK